MTPNPSVLLGSAANGLSRLVADHPEVATQTEVIRILLDMLAADIDTYIVRRLRWGEDIKAILIFARQSLSAEMQDAVAAVLEASPTIPEDFSIQAIETWLDGLMQVLTSVHAELEGQADDRRCEDIWRMLDDYVSQQGRHVPPIWRL